MDKLFQIVPGEQDLQDPEPAISLYVPRQDISFSGKCISRDHSHLYLEDKKRTDSVPSCQCMCLAEQRLGLNIS